MSNGITEADFDECEERLRKALGRPVLPAALWGQLVREGYVFPAMLEGFNSPEWQQLITAARQFSKDAREASTGTNLPPDARNREPADKAGVRLDDYTLLRAETFSEVAGALANRRTEVREFRAIYLGGTEARLTDEEAGAWVYGGKAPTNAIEDMREVSRRLSRAFRWRVGDADWFLLTGYVPFVRPVSVSVHKNSIRDVPNYLNRDYHLEGSDFMVDTAEIVITAEPWVDANIVIRAFKEVQKQVNGGDNRKITAKTLDAVRFVARRLRTDKIRWQQLRSEWNSEQDDPKRRYGSRDSLRKACINFLRPRYESPRYPDYDPTPWQEAEWAERERRLAYAKEVFERHTPNAPKRPPR